MNKQQWSALWSAARRVASVARRAERPLKDNVDAQYLGEGIDRAAFVVPGFEDWVVKVPVKGEMMQASDACISSYLRATNNTASAFVAPAFEVGVTEEGQPLAILQKRVDKVGHACSNNDVVGGADMIKEVRIAWKKAGIFDLHAGNWGVTEEGVPMVFDIGFISPSTPAHKAVKVSGVHARVTQVYEGERPPTSPRRLPN